MANSQGYRMGSAVTSFVGRSCAGVILEFMVLTNDGVLNYAKY